MLYAMNAAFPPIVVECCSFLIAIQLYRSAVYFPVFFFLLLREALAGIVDTTISFPISRLTVTSKVPSPAEYFAVK